MKIVMTIAFLLAGNASAFELQRMDTAAIMDSESAAVPAPGQKAVPFTPDTASALIKDYYGSLSSVPYEQDMPGTWEGRIFKRDPQGHMEAIRAEITFTKKTIPSELGPFFEEDRTETHVQFPYFEGLIERKVSFDPAAGISFQFRWDGLFAVTFRQMNWHSERVLLMKSDCYGPETYGYFIKKKASSKQAYTGALPTGDLFGPLPPYFHGQMPPLQANGQAVQGAYEYSNKTIFYKDQAQAQAAAEKAAEAIRAAGQEVLSVKVEELNGFYSTSVGFSGKRAILYRWNDDAPTAEKAAEVIKRKTDRYASEGYTILETNINKVGDKHFFFIMCAKFF